MDRDLKSTPADVFSMSGILRAGGADSFPGSHQPHNSPSLLGELNVTHRASGNSMFEWHRHTHLVGAWNHTGGALRGCSGCRRPWGQAAEVPGPPHERAVSLMLQSGKRQLSGPSPAHSLDLVAPGPSVRRRSPAPGEFSPVAGAAGAGSLFCSQCGNTEQLGIEES